MRKLLSATVIASLLLACANNGQSSLDAGAKRDTANATTAVAKDTTKKSIPSEVSKRLGNTDIKISYHAPAVRGRVVWGGLVPYDAVWVTGAHKATSLEVGKDFRVGNKTIPAGKYALFSVPGKEEWTIIINKNWNQHLADDYAEAEDLVRVKVKPQTTAETTERLNYAIEQTGKNAANIIVSWEKLRIPFEVKVL
jgi:hypothetical protein